MATCRSLLLLLLAMGGAARAQEPYVAASAGQSSWNFDCGPTSCDRTGNTWRAAAGVRFNRIFAVEAFLLDLGRTRSSQPGIDGDWRARAPGVQALIGWQTRGFDLAGKIGLASVRTQFSAAPASFSVSETRTNSELIGGVMLGYHFTGHLALRFDFDIVTVALDSYGVFYSRGADVSTASLGLAWHF